MTFQANWWPLFTEIFGPLVGLEEEWAGPGRNTGGKDLSASTTVTTAGISR